MTNDKKQRLLEKLAKESDKGKSLTDFKKRQAREKQFYRAAVAKSKSNWKYDMDEDWRDKHMGRDPNKWRTREEIVVDMKKGSLQAAKPLGGATLSKGELKAAKNWRRPLGGWGGGVRPPQREYTPRKIDSRTGEPRRGPTGGGIDPKLPLVWPRRESHPVQTLRDKASDERRGSQFREAKARKKGMGGFHDVQFRKSMPTTKTRDSGRRRLASKWYQRENDAYKASQSDILDYGRGSPFRREAKEERARGVGHPAWTKHEDREPPRDSPDAPRMTTSDWAEMQPLKKSTKPSHHTMQKAKLKKQKAKKEFFRASADKDFKKKDK